jgi:hypothetical protein
MGTFLALLPVGLSAVVLAAHFLRRGNLLFVLVCLWLVTLLFMKRPWALLVLQVAMVLGALEWAYTIWVLVPEREAAGEPWGRMAAILGAVALVAVGAALALASPAARRHFAGGSVPERESDAKAATPDGGGRP